MEQEQQPDRTVAGREIDAQLLRMLDALQNTVSNHLVGEERTTVEMRESIAVLTSKVDQFMLAFPGKDFRSHCEYHQLLIDAARAKRDSWQKVRYDLMRYSVIGFLIWAGYALWKAFLLGPK